MNIQVLIEAIRELLILLPAILVAITLHEYAQGYLAVKLGDPTPSDTGLFGFRPMYYIDSLGFLFFVAFGYGWARAIPVDSRNFKKPFLYSLYVYLSGMGVNLFVAIMFILLIILYKPAPEGYIYNLFMQIIRINMNYFIFSFFPLLPLSGGRLIAVLWDFYPRTEFIQMILLFLFFIFGGASFLDSIVISIIHIFM
ncbi:MAG: site-2 protease family protein [Spirochaetes bacterium]|nr:site-2 protease family protein [Spirochaetota bacterium]